MTEEEIKDKYYKEFCLIFKKKLKSILNPIINSKYHSYTTLTDVITNIILFELNIDKKAWEEIPKREVENNIKKARINIIDEMPTKKLAEFLSNRIKGESSSNNIDIWDIRNEDKEKIKNISLVILLEEFISKEH